MFNYNFHTHTHYCDGSSAPEAYVRAGLEAGLASLGFSGHAPVPLENAFAIRDDNSLEDYCHDIRQLGVKYEGQIEILLGLEVDFIPGISLDFDRFRQSCSLDYIIGSVHLVKNPEGKLWFIDGPERQKWINGLTIDYEGDIKRAVGDYYRQINQMIETQKPDIIGHLDKVKMHNHGEFFNESETWYTDLVRETLALVKEAGNIVEVNTRGLYKKRSESLFPGQWVLKEMQSRGIPVTISTDAHKPHEVALLLNEAVLALRAAGYFEAYIYKPEGWEGIFLDG